ncbi:MAG: RICIN domain-containing protein [Bacteroides sp.]|nr:RICIN domain-containing protein [Roseburia sp.]MCM1346767.1 RICIN domain-containing protein [Bacteroides sp.]MCM1420447.1 RICIN domain-containing protein [Bacteroides sp.]
MEKKHLKLALTATISLCCTGLYAQVTEAVPTASYNLVANMVTDRTLIFSTQGEGVSLPVVWGLDTAWPSSDNITRGIAYIGKENLGTARGSFQPNDLVSASGELSAGQKTALLERLNLIKQTGVTDIVLNCDHEVLNKENYVGKPEEWVRLIEATAKYAQSKGYNVVTVSPFNEPDYTSWGQGSMDDFRNVARLIKENPFFENIRVSGGNTLNCDEALKWYTYLQPYIDEGNTHQLAGDFNHYAEFFKQVRDEGKYATADELHNVMEAMVGAEYGMQTGIWWGFDGLARGEFCKASFGERLAYAEDRPHWSAASVYRSPDGKVQGFLGTSERQANNSSYRFVSEDRDVYFDGYGPQREFVVEMPGGTGYQNGQTNAERVFNITWGEDVQPSAISGRYIIMNKGTRKILSIQNGSTANGANICLNSDKGMEYQQWDIQPVDSRIGGDFSYYTISSVRDGKQIDVLNWSLSAGGNVIIYDGDKGANEQWYFEYAGNGDYYIKSRHSNLCLAVSSSAESANVSQAKQITSDRQKWRIIQVGAACELNAPAPPTGLTANSNPASVELTWNANTEEDLAGYMIYRAEVPDYSNDANIPIIIPRFEWNTIGRKIQGTSFIDNTVKQGYDYIYKIKAIDKSDNISEASDSIFGQISGKHAMIAQYQFEKELKDNTVNALDCSHYGTAAYLSGKSGERCIILDGQSDYIQLPYSVGDLSEMTIATWVYWKGGNTWQRIFDFGNGEDRYMFLTPSNGTSMRFAIKNRGEEQTLDCERLKTYSWQHVAVTLSDKVVTIYVNGEKVAESSDITIRPSDFAPILNYIGRSQFAADPMLKGNIDDFRIYNYALSADEVETVMGDIANGIQDTTASGSASVVRTEYYTANGLRLSQPQKGLNIVKNKMSDGSVVTEKIMF